MFLDVVYYSFQMRGDFQIWEDIEEIGCDFWAAGPGPILINSIAPLCWASILFPLLLLFLMRDGLKYLLVCLDHSSILTFFSPHNFSVFLPDLKFLSRTSI